MTRRHYVLLSEALRRVHPAHVHGMRVAPLYAADTTRVAVCTMQHRACCQAVADALGGDNPRFDVPRFMGDCGHATTQHGEAA